MPASVVAELATAVAALAELDPVALGEAALVEGLEVLLTVESQLRAVQAAWLAAAETVDATVAECGRAPRSWLIEEQRLGAAEASRRMRLARQLPAAPVLQAAFRAGDVSAEHASVILAALLPIPADLKDAVETALVDLARQLPPFEVARAVDQILTMLGVEPSADEAHARRYNRRGVTLAETFAGTGSLAGTLTAEARETLTQALTAASVACGPEDDRTAAQRRHDALAEIAEYYLAHRDLPAVDGQRPRIVVTIDYKTLLDELTGRWGLLDSGAPIPAGTARRLACDAEILPAVLGGRSEILDLGRTTRTFSAAIRRAAHLRDGHRCAYPRCRRPPAELHHLDWWSKGGRTSLDNAAWLCAFHHWLVHEGGWTAKRDPDGIVTFTSPDGRQHRAPPEPDAA